MIRWCGGLDVAEQRFEDAAGRVDLVLDLVGGELARRSWPLVKPGGALVTVVGGTVAGVPRRQAAGRPPRQGRARAVTAVVVLRDGWPAWKGLVVLTVSAGTHAFLDRRWPVRALLRATGSPGFARVEWGVLAVDQALHLCVLALLAVLVA